MYMELNLLILRNNPIISKDAYTTASLITRTTTLIRNFIFLNLQTSNMSKFYWSDNEII